jgi:hypothetical protein
MWSAVDGLALNLCFHDVNELRQLMIRVGESDILNGTMTGLLQRHLDLCRGAAISD